MNKKDEIIEEAYLKFASFKRPEHFTDYKHCKECAEFDAILQQYALGDISSNQLGTVSWSPVLFLTEDAYGYVMPRLIELSLNLELNIANELILLDWLIYISPSPENNRAKDFTKEQKLVVLYALKYIEKQIWTVVEKGIHENILRNAILEWSK